MQKYKICMLGAFCVGKTSLVSQYVSQVFPDTYLTTVGVKVDKKTVGLEGTEVTLMIWDIYGEDAVQSINPSYCRGMSGYLLIADGTRPETLEVADRVWLRVNNAFGSLPALLLLNKCDLRESWQLAAEELNGWGTRGIRVIETSARTGEGVETAFQELARRLTDRD